MRELKFRAWDKAQNKMYTGVGFDSIDSFPRRLYAVEVGPLPFICFEDVEIMQFTGVKDEYKVDVYEKDIIIFDNSDIGGSKYTGTIVWCNDPTLDSLGWGLWTSKGYLRTDFLGRIKIIGNEHENPELLKED